MTERSVTHATFVMRRTLAAPPARVFAAFAEADKRAKWFVSDKTAGTRMYRFDFREGGGEVWRGVMGGSVEIDMEGTFMDIVPGARIVVAYQMHMNGARISVSTQTTELREADGGTELTLTEYGAYLDGHDTPAQREHGTGELLDALQRSLAD
jgi:uncharacterized protein YndB with AHSA1/START domain